MISTNSTKLIVDNADSVSLTCNGQNNEQITWIQTINQTGIYFVDVNNTKTSVLNNGSKLLIDSVNLNDEEYYGCGVLYQNNSFKLLSSYFLYVRGKNILNIIFSNSLKK